ncbi:Gfo/Idh/MocA family oxidoreductase [Microbacterium paludicola]|uniref:Gfo/Idh/MocA family oxidoreductase n=1 Tax=Microbacterium paludicola TaxID=300019 RepID=A0A4Y9FXQ3_9MICO|nr:Gfo/Idh/MocA family oxidoreductase [Microbacterium paludicola]MBF0815552.1 Gfo/Idh/MocA family oxidoreductase [Microbacterium paludicola]TFU33815.1 Gfo/Idh/MocA family oxidoreductase [Microbacterium paludicola]
MSKNTIRVGIIGADTAASWAGASHIPAIAAQPRFVLEAVATRREESAKRAAEVFGARRWFADPYALIADPDVDLVTVAVKVPAHRDLVMAALAAGKAVYSESPLGANLRETEEMAAAVGTQHTAIGLQGSLNPSVRRAAEIIAKGAVGRVLSARVHATTFGYGPKSISTYDYFNKQQAGASFLTITTAHVLDVIETVLGHITEVDARTERLWPQVALTDSGETSEREVDDHIDLIAKTSSGAPVSVQVLAGVAMEDSRFTLEVRGAEGWVKLEGNHPGGVQVGDLILSASVAFDAPDAPASSGVGPTAAEFWTGAAINVGEVYASLARDIDEGTFVTPGFAHALHNRQLVARVEEAARSGQRQ